jgi:hypothetical protein
MIPGDLTKGRSAVRVRVKFIPMTRVLYPHYPTPEVQGWSEIRYTAYSWVLN